MQWQSNCVACNTKLDNPIISNVGILCRECSRQGLFRKRLIITGITRMKDDRVCVSGIDPETWRFVRPVYPIGGYLTRDFIMIGTRRSVIHFDVVEMEFTNYKPDQIHHTEDWLINERFTPKYIGHYKEENIIKILRYMAVSNLEEAIVAQDSSLFIVDVKRMTRIWHEHYEKFKVRINFEDKSGNLFEGIPATDLLLLAKVRWCVEKKRINYAQEMVRKFNGNQHKYIRISLTRLFRCQYWKQVTGLITVPDFFDGESFADYERRLGGPA